MTQHLCSQVCRKTDRSTHPIYTPMYKCLPDCLCEAAVAPRQLCIGPYSVHQELNSMCLFVQTWDKAHLGLPGTCSPIMEGQLTKAVHQIIVINTDVGLVFIFV